ncbi:MAG TPA: ribulose 1,5-bisphosphate carboxylase large subunit, partial [Lamprocystis sp. (in: g-proteobacteria)]|nr:ribulose 1,5-bisphosphate carboxylase large subunit [Lamprocystis sp. (in: g-proteobacteria)]
METPDPPLNLTGEHLAAVYQIAQAPTAAQAQARARDICIEQTVEFPEDLIPNAAIRDQILGQVAALESLGADRWRAVIRYPTAVVTGDLTQLLNC